MSKLACALCGKSLTEKGKGSTWKEVATKNGKLVGVYTPRLSPEELRKLPEGSSAMCSFRAKCRQRSGLLAPQKAEQELNGLTPVYYNCSNCPRPDLRERDLCSICATFVKNGDNNISVSIKPIVENEAPVKKSGRKPKRRK